MRAAALLGLALAACASPPPPAGPYVPNRRDYATFAAAWPDLYEPNYLPFMVHRAPGGPAGDLLFFCRWEADAMPLRVFLPRFEIPEALQDEFHPRQTDSFVAAVREALAIWQRELEGYVRFRLVEDAESADVTVHLVAARAPQQDPELKVLGMTPLDDACRVVGRDPDADRLLVEFQAPELRIFLADEFGLLAVDQVQWIALHEIGHALGMRGHSPIPADLMYEVARDRQLVREGLSIEDVNSFLSLYRLPNGSVFGRASRAPGAPGLEGPGPPQLALAPYVDSNRGYSLRLPDGWTHFGTPHGVVAVDGQTWDYAASFQVAAQRYDTIEAFLGRYGPYYLSRGHLTRPAALVVNGRRAVQIEIELHEAPRIEQVTLIEVGDGRVLVVTADCPRQSVGAYRPWFSAVLGSFEIVDLPEDAWPRRRRKRP